MRVRAVENIKLKDDEFVAECMLKLQQEYPQIDGYMFERVDDNYIQIMIYGEHFEVKS